MQGPRCRHKHIKKIACEAFLAGFCPDGPQCKFGHPKYELPRDDTGTTGATAYVKRPRTPMVCHKCGAAGHKVMNCPLLEQHEVHSFLPVCVCVCGYKQL